MPDDAFAVARARQETHEQRAERLARAAAPEEARLSAAHRGMRRAADGGNSDAAALRSQSAWPLRPAAPARPAPTASATSAPATPRSATAATRPPSRPSRRAILAGDLDPEALAITFNNRGVAYSELGDFDRAISDYGQALALTPGDATAIQNLRIAHIRRAAAAARLGERDAALADYDRAIELDPDPPAGLPAPRPAARWSAATGRPPSPT